MTNVENFEVAAPEVVEIIVPGPPGQRRVEDAKQEAIDEANAYTDSEVAEAVGELEQYADQAATTAADAASQSAAAGLDALSDSLSAVATSGAYDDLSGRPTLGTASVRNEEDFASAVQGSKADSASQPGHAHSKSDITDFNEDDYATGAEGDLASTAVQPEDIGTAASLDAPAVGDAEPDQVVLGNDSRLGDARLPLSHSHDEYLLDSEASAVATSGNYEDLNNTPAIPSVPEDIGAATAAQGALADSASQPGHSHDIDDLNTTGTPDGTKFLRDDGSWQPVATGSHDHDGDYATAAHDHGGAYEPAGAASAAVLTHEATHAPADAITAADHALIDHTGIPGAGSDGGGGHIIKNNDVVLPQRGALNFVGDGVAVSDEVSGSVDIPYTTDGLNGLVNHCRGNAIPLAASQVSTHQGFSASLAIDGSPSSYSHTANVANAWWQIDFGSYEVVPESFSLRGRTGEPHHHFPRFYRIEGSSDAETWTEVYTTGGTPNVVPIDDWLNIPVITNEAYRYFRITQTGTDSSGTHYYLILSEFEVYGSLRLAGLDGETVITIPATIPDAPQDGTQYARKDGAWEPVEGGGGGVVHRVFHAGYRNFTASQVVQVSPDVIADDLLVAIIQVNSSRVITPPSGWALKASYVNSGGYGLKTEVFTKVALAGDASSSPTFTVSTASNLAVSILGYRGVAFAGAKAVNASGVATLDTPLQFARTADIVLHAWSVQDNGSGPDELVSMSGGLANLSAFTGSDAYARVFVGEEVVATESSAKTATWGPTTATATALSILLRATHEGIPDAPQDGTQYARKDGAWEPVEGGGGGSGFAPDPSAQPDGKWLTTEAGEYVFTDAPGSDPGAPVVTGGTVLLDGDYVVREFLSSGTLDVSGADLAGVEVLLVGGGGAGGVAKGGGGGGGGVISTVISLPVGPYSIEIGAGGLGQLNARGLNGGDTTAFGLTAIGGGGGGSQYDGATNGLSGGSGGGAASSSSKGGTGGTGMPGQGKPGGNAISGSSSGGGGGGALLAGEVGAGGFGGAGGGGIESFITGEALAFGGGGGGGSANGVASGGAGGLGGGGAGGGINFSHTSGAPGTGGGGGGSYTANQLGSNGGSGAVYVRYLNPDQPSLITADQVGSEAAPAGHVLTSDGEGGASWAAPSTTLTASSSVAINSGNSVDLNPGQVYSIVDIPSGGVTALGGTISGWGLGVRITIDGTVVIDALDPVFGQGEATSGNHASFAIPPIVAEESLLIEIKNHSSINREYGWSLIRLT